jgi:hypothetical protein
MKNGHENSLGGLKKKYMEVGVSITPNFRDMRQIFRNSLFIRLSGRSICLTTSETTCETKNFYETDLRKRGVFFWMEKKRLVVGSVC